jgi:hypothetical protein
MMTDKQPRPSIKVGDRIYVLREHCILFSEYEVVAETSISWVVLSPGTQTWQMRDLAMYGTKLPKTGRGYRLGTKNEAELVQWGLTHRYEISRLVDRLENYTMLLTIARMVGYDKLLEVNL